MLVRAGAVVFKKKNCSNKGKNLRGKIHKTQDYIQKHTSSFHHEESMKPIQAPVYYPGSQPPTVYSSANDDYSTSDSENKTYRCNKNKFTLHILKYIANYFHKIRKIRVKEKLLSISISNDEIEKLKKAVSIGVMHFEKHIATLTMAIQYMHYGRALRMEIANAIEMEFPGAFQQLNGTTTKFVLPSSFSFFVAAEKDFNRTAKCKADAFWPNLFPDNELRPETDKETGNYELVLVYERMSLKHITLIPHDNLFPAITIWDKVSSNKQAVETSVGRKFNDIAVKAEKKKNDKTGS